MVSSTIKTPEFSSSFHPAHERLDQAPQLGRVQFLFREEAGDFVVADCSAGHLREAGGGGVAEGAYEVVAVEFEEVRVHNALSLLHPRVSLVSLGLLRKVRYLVPVRSQDERG